LRLAGLSITVALLPMVVLVNPTPLPAGELTYTVRHGQSLSLICKEVYGDKDLFTLVALYNGKNDPTKVSSGEILRIPFSDRVILGRGESLSGLAKRIWGDAKKYPVVAWANGIQDPARIPAGTHLTVPVLIPYRLKRGESVSSVAARFYHDPKQFAPIVSASGIKDPARVTAGSQLKIPYIFPRPAVKTALSNTEKTTSPDPGTDKAMALLGRAEAAFRAGRYGEAWTTGYEAARGLKGKDKAKALRLLAASQYAFGKMDEALEDLKAAYTLDPEFRPDPAYVNPEMMRLYEQAREK
jgi:LysM repeat protein